MKKKFLERLGQGPIVFDGAIGTQLYERGIFINRCFDQANIAQPELVETVHRNYLESGAEVLTTNSFSSNRIRLRRHGLEEEAEKFNRAAVEIAQKVAQDHAWVAGSIGPTGWTPSMLTASEIDEMLAAFRDQARWLTEAGADVLILETFRQVSEIKIAVEAIKSVSDLPVIAQASFDAEHRTADGAAPDRFVLLAREWGVDVVGANCFEGPHLVFQVVEEMVGRGLPVIAQPNAGYPRKVDDRLIYMATPEYYGVFARRFFKAGVDIVGGCCGTGPEHIRQVQAAARMLGGAIGGSDRPIAKLSVVPTSPVVAQEEVPASERTRLSAKIERIYQERVKGSATLKPDTFAVSVEVNAPSGLDLTRALDAAKMLRQGGVDVINIADGPRASARISNWAMATRLQQELQTEVILHVCGRDRNLLGLQSDILAFHALGLHNLVVITGDPPKVGDYPHATAVFDLDSIGILRLVSNFNRGIDPAGKDFGDVTRFYCACGAEPAALDYDREIRRLEEKREAGARFIMTQPVYDPDVLDRFLKDIEHLQMPVMVGLLPLASHRNAEFLHHEVPGMRVPDEIRDRMKSAGSGPVARAEGVRIAQETLMNVKDRVVGAYIMPPFGRYRAALEILSCLDGFAELDTEVIDAHS